MIGELAALGAAISWTISGLLYRRAVKETKPISANTVRLISTSLVLFAFLSVTGRLWILTDLPTNAVVLASISGIVGLGIGDTFYMISLKSLGTARAVPITCTYPLFSLAWATLVGRPITLSVVIGATVILAGIWLLSRENELGYFDGQKASLSKGIAFGLATALIWSISIAMIDLTIQKTSSIDEALAINTIRVTAIALSLLVLSPIIERRSGIRHMRRKVVAELILGGIVALGIGWFLLTYSLMMTSESQAVPISSTTPLFSTVASIALLHEKATLRNAIGSVMIVIGISIAFLTSARLF